MATSKTLTPTNETIQIPAMTDAPDASVFSNCIDKEADAINALNSKRTIVQTQVQIPSVTSQPGQVSQIVQNFNLRNATVTALESIPSTGTIIGAVVTWIQGAVFIVNDTLIENQLLSVRAINSSSVPVTSTAMRLIVFLR